MAPGGRPLVAADAAGGFRAPDLSTKQVVMVALNNAGGGGETARGGFQRVRKPTVGLGSRRGRSRRAPIDLSRAGIKSGRSTLSAPTPLANTWTLIAGEKYKWVDYLDAR